ncbi:hypothetical protein L210DRAFT_891783 [Boletus edulis BED1]|uniref:Uncharacterized protein n=1 Tax=Boletus edulis BED1 TaxID=1328754 RepID=A0AAD4BCV4_BOLED|nr:hypothetical protein L210DRAFT_891783 [Boletus edulis BED1]
MFRITSPAPSVLSASEPPSEPPSSPIRDLEFDDFVDPVIGRADCVPPINTSITFPPDNLPCLPINAAWVASKLDTWLTRVAGFCAVCYFQHERRPISVIELYSNGGRRRWEDYHHKEPERCPWRLLHPSTAYQHFQHQVYSAIRIQHPSEPQEATCVICEEAYACRAVHELHSHGASLFIVAFLVWEEASTCNSVFSFLQGHVNVAVPCFCTREEYAIWLGRPACAPWTDLLNVHLVAASYCALKSSDLLPKPQQPEVEDVVVYRSVF